MKSPNMMSTTGRRPVIAAPTPRPVMPASEMGESITRSGPNSSTSPDRTLKAVPASATSSPTTNTRGSRRSSSASASRIASANVSSRAFASGIDMLVHLAHIRIRGADGELRRRLDLCFHICLNSIQHVLIGEFLVDQEVGEFLQRVAQRHPFLLFFLRPVVGAVDVTDVVTTITVRMAQQESRPLAPAHTLGQALNSRVDGPYVLAIHFLGGDAESFRPRQ